MNASNTNHDGSHNQNHSYDIDAFTRWLDGGASEKAPPARSDEPDTDLAAIRQAARQLHDLDVGFQHHAATVSARRHQRTWEDFMQTYPNLSPSVASPTDRSTPHRSHDHRRTPRWLTRPWQVAINATLAAVLILGLGIGLWREFGPSTPLPWQDGSPGYPKGLTLSGTPDANDTTSSSVPYPTAAECTVTPLTKEQVHTHFEAANTPAKETRAVYSKSVYPSAADAEAIMATYRMWQACGLRGPVLAHRLALETPEFTATMMGRWFFDGDGYIPVDKRPLSEDAITCLTDLAMVPEEQQDTLSSCSSFFTVTVATPGSIATPITGDGSPPRTVVSIPAGATPIANSTGGRAFPSIFTSSITLYGPDQAIAQAYWIDERTGEITYSTPKTIKFVKVDGHWLIDYQRDGALG